MVKETSGNHKTPQRKMAKNSVAVYECSVNMSEIEKANSLCIRLIRNRT